MKDVKYKPAKDGRAEDCQVWGCMLLAVLFGPMAAGILLNVVLITISLTMSSFAAAYDLLVTLWHRVM